MIRKNSSDESENGRFFDERLFNKKLTNRGLHAKINNKSNVQSRS